MGRKSPTWKRRGIDRPFNGNDGTAGASATLAQLKFDLTRP